jgi:hypothetical protein
MRLLAMVEDPATSPATWGEANEVPARSPGRRPAYWESRVLGRQAPGMHPRSAREPVQGPPGLVSARDGRAEGTC